MVDDHKIEGTEGNSEISDLIPESKGDSGFLRKCFLLLGGLVLVILGIIGWVLPFLMGIPLIVAGLAMISVVIPPLRKLLNAWEAKLPTKWRHWIRSVMKRDDSGSTSEIDLDEYFSQE